MFEISSVGHQVVYPAVGVEIERYGRELDLTAQGCRRGNRSLLTASGESCGDGQDSRNGEYDTFS